MAARTKKATERTPAPVLTVLATVTVHLGEDGLATVNVKTNCGGEAKFVHAMKPAQAKLNIAGAALRRVVMGTISAKRIVPPADLLPATRQALRA